MSCSILNDTSFSGVYTIVNRDLHGIEERPKIVEKDGDALEEHAQDFRHDYADFPLRMGIESSLEDVPPFMDVVSRCHFGFGRVRQDEPRILRRNLLIAKKEVALVTDHEGVEVGPLHPAVDVGVEGGWIEALTEVVELALVTMPNHEQAVHLAPLFFDVVGERHALLEVGPDDGRRHDDAHRRRLLLVRVVAVPLALLGVGRDPVPDELMAHRSRAQDLDGDAEVLGDALVPELLGDLRDEPVERVLGHGRLGLMRDAPAVLDERRHVLEPGLGGQHRCRGEKDAKLSGHASSSCFCIYASKHARCRGQV